MKHNGNQSTDNAGNHAALGSPKATSLAFMAVIAVLALPMPSRAQTYPVTLSGAGVSGDTVLVYNGATLLGSAPVTGGQWALAVNVVAGIQTFTVYQQDSSGNESWVSAYGIQQQVGPVSCGTPVVEPPPGVAAPVNPITSSAPGTPVKMNSSNGFGTNYTNPNGPNYGYFIINGTNGALPGATVALYDGATFIGSGTANSSGAWTITTTLPVDTVNGSYAVMATQTTAAGISPISAPFLFAYSWTPNNIVGSETIVPASGDVPTGNSITVTANIMNPSTGGPINVVVTGHPTLTLNTGTVLTYASGSGTPALKFTGTVGAGQSTSGVGVKALNMNGGTIKGGGVSLDTVSANGGFAAVSSNWPNPALPTITCAQVGG